MKIAITSGDPNGIGIEVFLKSLSKHNLFDGIEIHFYGSTWSLIQWLDLFKYNYGIENGILLVENSVIHINDIGYNYNIEPGVITYQSGKVASIALEKAVADTITGNIDALVTLPIAKEAMYLSGWDYPGHTEMIADRCSTNNPLMILFKDNIRAALVTIHSPLHKVPDLISIPNVLHKIVQFNKSLKYDFSITNPRIAVLGLNPHAGENGTIGREEVDIINPAIKSAKEKGVICEGAFPADGFFAHKDYLNFDGFLAMYHDQGLIPLKLLANGGGVNFTAGLPIVRTSPDHGTAFSIAGNGIANEQSMIDAIESAVVITNNRKSIKK